MNQRKTRPKTTWAQRTIYCFIRLQRIRTFSQAQGWDGWGSVSNHPTNFLHIIRTGSSQRGKVSVELEIQKTERKQTRNRPSSELRRNVNIISSSGRRWCKKESETRELMQSLSDLIISLARVWGLLPRRTICNDGVCCSGPVKPKTPFSQPTHTHSARSLLLGRAQPFSPTAGASPNTNPRLSVVAKSTPKRSQSARMPGVVLENLFNFDLCTSFA